MNIFQDVSTTHEGEKIVFRGLLVQDGPDVYSLQLGTPDYVQSLINREETEGLSHDIYEVYPIPRVDLSDLKAIEAALNEIPLDELAPFLVKQDQDID